MSENVLYIIPVNPLFMPDSVARTKALEMARQIDFSDFPQHQIYEEVTDNPVFYYTGEGFETITCPLCGQELSPHFFAEALKKAAALSYSDLSIKAPCCEKKTTLAELIVEPAVGFACYSLTFRNITHCPERIATPIFEKLLHCQLRLLWSMD